MAHFMLQWQFAGTSAKAMVDKPQDRTGPAKTLIEGFGGKLHHYYFAFGDYDGIGIVEFPDNTSAAVYRPRFLRHRNGAYAASALG
jgi:uncharacterized protein with GYD domain